MIEVYHSEMEVIAELIFTIAISDSSFVVVRDNVVQNFVQTHKLLFDVASSLFDVRETVILLVG